MAAVAEKKITCKTPSPGKQPTRIAQWKYDVVRSALLRLVPKKGDGVIFRDLPKMVAKALKPNELKQLGSASWYTTVVKLHLEVIGELKRVPDATPQRLLRT